MEKEELQEEQEQQIPKPTSNNEIENLNNIFSVKYIHGYDGTLKNNILGIRDRKNGSVNRIIYTAGHSIIICPLGRKEQSYIRGTEGASEITALTLSLNDRYLAYAEEADTALITVYDLFFDPKSTGESHDFNMKKKKILVTTDCDSRKYIHLSFSHKDSKYLASMTKNFRIIIWEWDRNKARCKVDVSSFEKIHNMFFHPMDNYLFITGKGSSHAIKIYSMKFEKNEVQLIQRNETKKDLQQNYSENILSYCFVEKEQGFIFGTDCGELLFMNKNLELKGKLPTSPHNEFSITNIQPSFNGYGFIAAGTICKFLFYEKNPKDVKHPFTSSEKKIYNKLLENVGVNCFIQPNDEILIAGLTNGSLMEVNLTSNNLDANQNYGFEPLIFDFHTDVITDLDVCFMKPLIATCSKDKTVKIWNYELNELENSKKFGEEANAISFHPSGFHVSVAFTSRIQMINIMLDDMKAFGRINDKNCTDLQYSQGGQYLAVAKDKAISFYSAYTGEFLSEFNIRVNSVIPKIIWHPNDMGIFSLERDGQLAEWYLEDSHQRYPVMNETNLGDSFDFILNDNNNCEVYACSTENYIYHTVNEKKEVNNYKDKDLMDGKKFSTPPVEIIPAGSNICTVKFCNTGLVLLLGTGKKGSKLPGMLRAYRYPLNGSVGEIQLHKRTITKIQVTADDSMIFTVGEDNIISIVQMSDVKTRKSEKNADMNTPYQREFLYDKDYYVDKVNAIKDLSKELRNTQEHTRRINEEKNRNRERVGNELKEKLMKMRKAKRDREEKLKREKTEMELRYRKEMNKINEEHEREKVKMHEVKEKRIKQEKERIHEQQEKKKELDVHGKHALKEFHERSLSEQEQLKRRHTMLLDEAENENRTIADKKRRLEQEHMEEIEGIEDQGTNDIEKLKDLYGKRTKALKADNEVNLSLLKTKMQNCALKENDKRSKEAALKNIDDKINQLNDQITGQGKKKTTQEEDIEERRRTIHKKNERINELMRKTQELEKFKFVLDYKIKELTRDIGPREEEISKMKEQLEVMKSEVEEFKRTKDHLLLFVNDFQLKLKGINKQMTEQESLIKSNEEYINAYENDLADVCQYLGDHKLLKKSVVELYNKYVQNDSKKIEATVDRQKTFIEQRAYMETHIDTHKKKFKKNNNGHKQENKRIMVENVHLIKAINELRRDMKDEDDKRMKYEKWSIDQEILNSIEEQIKMNEIALEILTNRYNELVARPPPEDFEI